MNRYAMVWSNAVMNMYKITNGDGIKGTVTVLYRSARDAVFRSSRCHRCSRHVSPLRNCVWFQPLFVSSRDLVSARRGATRRSGRGVREAYNNNIAIIAFPIKISPDKASTRGFVSRERPTKRQRRLREQHCTRSIVAARWPASEVSLSCEKK